MKGKMVFDMSLGKTDTSPLDYAEVRKSSGTREGI